MTTFKGVPPATVERIRALYNDPDEPWTQGRLARHFGFSINTIGRIVRGETHQGSKHGVRLDLNIERLDKAKASEERMRRLLEPGTIINKEEPK